MSANNQARPVVIGDYPDINSALCSIKAEFSGSVIGAGLYLSDQKSAATLIGSASTIWVNEGQVADHVYARRLLKQDSCGAHAAIDNQKIIAPSRMFKTHHCLNLPLGDCGAALQIVSLASSPFYDVPASSNLQTLTDQLTQKVEYIRAQFGDQLDKIVPLRENRPTHLVLEFDITGFSEVYVLRGRHKALELADSLHKTLETKLLPSLQPQAEMLDRDGGDAFWVSIDLVRLFENKNDFESNFPAFLNQELLPLIERSFQDFEEQARELGMQDRTPLKSVLSLGSVFAGRRPGMQAPAYSGQTLVALANIGQQADRHCSSITVGDDILPYIDPFQYDIARIPASAKAALSTEHIASVRSMP